MGKKREKYRKYIRILTGVLFISGTGLLAAARKIPGFADWYSRNIYRMLEETAGRFFGLFPFSVVEVGLYAGILFLIFLLFSCRRRPGILLEIYGFILAALLFSYSAGCGINYYRKPFSSYLDWEGRTVESGDLGRLCSWLTEKVNEAGEELEKTEGIYENMPEKGQEAMKRLAKIYPCLSGYYPRSKPVLVSQILSVQQVSGIYSPFTIEANYNRDMVSYNIPHTICHELSHLRGFMREDEANFIGYLACLESEDADYRYSGYLLGWIYAGNALAKEDYAEYVRLYGLLDEKIREDLEANNRFWARYEGKAAEAADKVNDAYLKINGQAEGTKTYGRVVDLMILDFIKNKKEVSCIETGKMIE